jgi:hypothetical protein
MTLPTTARLLFVLGRLVGFAGAVLTIALMAWWEYDLVRYLFFSENSTWGEVGAEPFVAVLRIVVAGWVVWSAIRSGGRALLRALLVAFGVSFFLLYGWYFLLTGMDWGFLYWVVGGDFLYLVAGLMVGCALLLPAASTRPGNDSP